MKAVVSATKTEAANNADQIGGGPKLTHQQLAEKEKKRIARKKERRATLILGLIMGSFIACWFPFFFMYSISPICPICENFPVNERPACCVRGWGFTFAFWLGYSNSALNPVIYTIFNKDFRRAFKRILFKWIWIFGAKTPTPSTPKKEKSWKTLGKHWENTEKTLNHHRDILGWLEARIQLDPIYLGLKFCTFFRAFKHILFRREVWCRQK